MLSTFNIVGEDMVADCSFCDFTTEFQNNTPAFDGSVLVLLDFSSSDPCWFNLQADTPDCGDNSPQFTLLPVQRSQSDSKTTLGLLSSTATAAGASGTGASSASDHPHDQHREELSVGAKAGIAIAVTLACIVVLGMAAWLYFRRRKRLQEGSSTFGRGKKGREKLGLSGSSGASNKSAEPLQVQPVYDGFPGSTGYDDVRSMESSTYLHSPQSPSSSSNGGFFSSEREELNAARLHSGPVASTVVSYGPNPVTPNLTPRPSTRFDPPSSGSGGSHEEYYAPSTQSIHSHAHSHMQSTPKPAPPLVVSYGPNRITPTPVISKVTVPPDDAVMKRVPDLPEFPVMAFPSHPFPSHEPQAPYEVPDVSDEPANAVGPLPPYASAADFYAMEKGAIRKIQEPTAQAELPPTKDGYYHDGDHTNDFELPGALPPSEDQHPYQPYRNQMDSRGRREVDEQKFLLSDVEISRMRQQKAAARAAMRPAGESYEMQPGTSSASQSQGPGQGQEHYQSRP